MTLDSTIGKHLAQQQILAVVMLQDPNAAIPLAKALLRGGINTIELTLRTPTALESVKRITSEVPEMTVGAGTILSQDQADQAKAAGAHFAVSPSVNREVLKHAKSIDLPFAPGVMTPTDIDISIQEGYQLLKFFPATSSGGLAHLKNIAAPFAHLGIGFVPLGGINLGNLKEWVTAPNVVSVGGSWLAPTQSIAESKWDLIEKSAREACAVKSKKSD